MFTRRGAITALGIGIAGATAFADAREAPRYDDPDDLYAALRDQPVERIILPDGEIALVFADGAPGLDRDRLRAWVQQAADAVTRYFGRFPVKHYGLLVIAEDGDTVGHATTFGYAGSATRIHVGRSTDRAAFARDWVLTHEMLPCRATRPAAARALAAGRQRHLCRADRPGPGRLSVGERRLAPVAGRHAERRARTE